MTAFGLAFPALLITGGIVLFADAIPEIETIPLSNGIRGTIGLFWLFGVFLIGMRTASARTHIEAEPLMLTSVSARTVAGGLVVAETLRVLTYLSLYTLLATGIAVILLGSLPSLVLIPATAVLFAVTAVVAGSVCGYAVAWLVATSRFVARHKTVLGGTAAVLLMGVYFLFLYPQLGIVSQSSLGWLPIAWLTDFAAIGSPLQGSSIRAGGAVLTSLFVLIAGGLIIERETIAFWYTDPVSPDSGEATDNLDSPSDGTESSRRDALAASVTPLVIPRLVARPTRRVAEWTLLRTRREPNRLTFVLTPLLAIGGSLLGSYADSLTLLAAPAAAIVLAWLAGALFALNPLGDEGVVLPATLTAVSGKQYVRGLMTPGLVFGFPIVVVITAIAGVFSPYTLSQRIGLVVLGGFLTCVAVGTTPAIGMALPRFSAISIGQSDDVLPPRISATLIHFGLIGIPGSALVMLLLVPEIARGALAVLVGTVPAFILSVFGSSGGAFASVASGFREIGDMVRAFGLIEFRIGGIIVLVLGGIVAATVLYRHAIRRFDRYSLD
ncbi:hypothetical protein C451_02794 [Halococcus thailandensis JCM 13552]|uniref:ABC-2 type transport system permease protein n=2 Tax=Halococcus thailandensis TaxID=335952 RepID=M0NFM5_9EURY|nr:hypothetical protein C451_02794 [Halococcus thailandensis JCM 13552]